MSYLAPLLLLLSISAAELRRHSPVKMLGDLFKPKRSAPPLPQAHSSWSALPSWGDIDKALRAQETSAERQAYEDVMRGTGRGPASHQANLRLFDKPEGYDPQVTLYRDTAGWCPYCEKVWLYLEEKRVPYRVEKVPMSCYGRKPAEFLRLNPSGGIPVAVVRGKVIKESNDIIYLMEREFGPSEGYREMLPSGDSPLRAKVQPLLQLERRLFGSWFSWLTSRGGDGDRRELDQLFSEVDRALGSGSGPFFLGAEISIVDCMFAPFLERMAASLPYYKGFVCRGPSYPHLLRWFEAMDGKTSYAGLKSDYYTHVRDLPPQIGACLSLPEARAAAVEIDGGAWRIDADPALLLEPMLPADPQEARRDAVRRIVGNHEKLVAFACRAAGKRGSPSVAAPLADPYAVADESYAPAVDTALRTIAGALLSGATDVDPGVLRSLATREVQDCLLYVRERVGVPRDMTVHGARLFRAHINWFVDAAANV